MRSCRALQGSLAIPGILKPLKEVSSVSILLEENQKGGGETSEAKRTVAEIHFRIFMGWVRKKASLNVSLESFLYWFLKTFGGGKMIMHCTRGL